MKGLIITCFVLILVIVLLITICVLMIKKNNSQKEKLNAAVKKNENYSVLVQSVYNYLRKIQKIEDWEKTYNEKSKNQDIDISEFININNNKLQNNTSQ